MFNGEQHLHAHSQLKLCVSFSTYLACIAQLHLILKNVSSLAPPYCMTHSSPLAHYIFFSISQNVPSVSAKRPVKKVICTFCKLFLLWLQTQTWRFCVWAVSSRHRRPPTLSIVAYITLSDKAESSSTRSISPAETRSEILSLNNPFGPRHLLRNPLQHPLFL